MICSLLSRSTFVTRRRLYEQPAMPFPSTCSPALANRAKEYMGDARAAAARRSPRQPQSSVRRRRRRARLYDGRREGKLTATATPPSRAVSHTPMPMNGATYRHTGAGNSRQRAAPARHSVTLPAATMPPSHESEHIQVKNARHRGSDDDEAATNIVLNVIRSSTLSPYLYKMMTREQE